ncbi:transcriptional regulator [Liquorilactobacillus sucicola DSM 21376 = JCM 15457]|uniref:Transcription regulator n=1 Tax=Liquorilactobacillus sucicola DSM 21376 = JCM 15457 TaxID=1423806 RepID=A0A023CZU3_9LACO|nr:TetR/AcrR family transcriptional regulator [Liquorilactobacillus sucicola]KRN06757.1 transcription regulator [Liquorilactobacillus sucicola DSM 21376 = JCM 15457]GAJ27030.1 transcriptional regulator [Liquorilactobacillus sucicola DSM 21376 = JCM 15457]
MTGKRNNRRTLYTKKVIRESFLELLRYKELETITVTDICRSADINRGTFYRYYRNPLDLMQHLQDELYRRSMYLIKQRFKGDSCEMLGTIFEVLKSTDPEIVKVIIDKQKGYTFLEEIFDGAKEATRPFLMQRINWLTDVQFDYFYAYITNGAIGVISQWIRSGMSHDTDKIEKTFSSMFEQSKKFMEDKGSKFHKSETK